MEDKESNNWDATKYHKYADFVSKLAMPVVELLAPKKGEYILDIGCGEGSLACEIESSGAKVVAVDLSEDMVEKTKAKGVEAYVMSAIDLYLKHKFDAVFSNATLHWVLEPQKALEEIYKVLKKDGRFIAEFGAKGNIKHLIIAMQTVFDNHPEFGTFQSPWYFPSIKDYQVLLEEIGFKVVSIESITRPTKIDDITNWLDIFANGIVKHLSKEQKVVFKKEVKGLLEHLLYSEKDGWVVDYVRLRLKVIKSG
jgi:2-isopropylmalate synthase